MELLRYDLQFFGDEKTEDATAKKISETRKQGSVAKSQELSYAISLIAVFLALKFFSSYVGEHFLDIIKWVYSSVIPDMISNERGGVTAKTMSDLMNEILVQLIIIVLPFFIIGFIVAGLSTGLQFKFEVTFEPLKPKLNKFNPINGFKRIFSTQAIFNLGLSIIKIAVIFAIAYSSIVTHLPEIFILYDLDLNAAIALIGDIVIDTGLRIGLVYLVVGFADLFYQRFKFKKDIKMTKQEVKDEYKNSEGDPQIKGKQKQKMREVSQKRMMQSVPQADVVITNPTHIAVALKYEAFSHDAPVVVAKGEDYIALRIKESARENGVSIVENPPLARSLYTTVDLNGVVPPELFEPVARILAEVYRSSEYIAKHPEASARR
ncbi:MAG: flagellar biosynthesis protein FlhB [Lachnospiraceae bacterium]|nr:flagellar biosynthesis protein FlhB [Lachnospiraceae bacterium]